MEDTPGQGQATDPNESIVERAVHVIEDAASQAEHALHDMVAGAPAPQQPAPDAPAAAPAPAPTRAEAREMFKANPGLWSIATADGPMTRDEC
jgi:hypothetical protein